LIVRQD